MSTNLTAHARTRMQQRGIRAAALDVLLDYGRVEHADRGCEIVFFDKTARARLLKHNPGATRDLERVSRSYAILGSDGAVITVGSRYRRIQRH